MRPHVFRASEHRRKDQRCDIRTPDVCKSACAHREESGGIPGAVACVVTELKDRPSLAEAEPGSQSSFVNFGLNPSLSSFSLSATR